MLDVIAARGQVDSVLPGGTDWWRTAVIYQAFLRSFADGSADGVGDLPRSPFEAAVPCRLGRGRHLGQPWYPSPMVDVGYDIPDHRHSDPTGLGVLAFARGTTVCWVNWLEVASS